MTMGRHFLQIPGPSPEPDAVMRAVAATTIDHRGPDFQALGTRLLHRIRAVFRTTQPVMIYSSSASGAWEAALVNTLSPGDEVLFYDAGYFATLWRDMAARLGLTVRAIDGDWRHGIDSDSILDALRADTSRSIKAVCVVHNETSTGITNDIPAIRAVMDEAEHPALLMVDTVSGLGSIEYRHDDWRVDVSVAGSQKGLMLPPGLGFTAVSQKALEASRHSRSPRSYWDWAPMLVANERGSWPTTPSTNLLYGLEVSLDMLADEGMDAVFERHDRWGRATRAAVDAWGLETVCLDPERHSPVVTAVMAPDGVDADALRDVVLRRFDMSLGAGLGRLAGRVFRIGHLGWTNDLTILGALAGIQMGLELLDVPLPRDGVAAAMDILRFESASFAPAG
jgi:alanine-glyoxylate transaminase / serine-glyoxylate transaminase / serine-pyruvate transaminase